MSKKKSAITLDDVTHVAKLASLPLTDEEALLYQQHLTSIIEYISKINALDTQNVPETNQVTGLTNVFRQDKIDEERMLTQDQALSNAQNTHNGYFVVPILINQ